jgi:very-short-patch-repair endonuclease
VTSQAFHPDRLSASTAAAQHGVLNQTQARAAGVSDRARQYRRRTGRYERVLPKVDRIAGSVQTWHQQVVGALLWAGPASVASHRCAAALWGFDSCPPGSVEITSPRNLRCEIAEHVTIHRYQVLTEDEVETLGDIRLTAPPRTLLDLAAVVRSDRLDAAMDSALRRKQVTLPQLRLTLSRNARRGRRGIQAFRRALDVRDGGYVASHRGLQKKIWRLIEASDLPTPLQEYPVIEGDKEIYRIDFAYPDRMMAIEADGWEFHSDRRSWSNDQGRSNVLTIRGWRLLRFTDQDATETQDDLIAMIFDSL